MTTPTVPEVIRVIERFRRALLALDNATAAMLVQAYGPVFVRLRREITSILEEVKGKAISVEQAQQVQRLESLERQIAAEMNTYARLANGRITEAQRQAIGLARQAAQRTVDAALPPGIDTRLLARAGLSWNTLPASAFANLVGASGAGTPLFRLLAPLGNLVRDGVIGALREGIALGRNPRDTAALVQKQFGLGLTRSLTIARTETLRSYRQATRMEYAANPGVVKGYQRHSAKDSRVCMACIVLDGTFYGLDEPLNEHPNGRCALRPIVATYRDLGLNVEQPPDTRVPARDWFEAQTEGRQREMMGNARYEAWREGKFTLDDLVKVERSRVWGDSAVERPLRELVGG